MLVLHGATIIAPVVLLVVRGQFRVTKLGICLFKTLLGIECPACGGTRSATALFMGRIEEAFTIHPAAPIAVGILAVVTVYLSVVVFSGHEGLDWSKETRVYNVLDAVLLTAIFVGWVGKLLTS